MKQEDMPDQLKIAIKMLSEFIIDRGGGSIDGVIEFNDKKYHLEFKEVTDGN